VIITL